MAAQPDLLGILKGLSRELRELDVGAAVPRVACPSALDFLRGYVAPNKPVVVTGAIDHWPALRLWSNEYLAAAAGLVTVALTPYGRADAVAALPGGAAGEAGECFECFALPYQRRMPMGEFLGLLCRRRRRPDQPPAAAAAEPRIDDAEPASQPSPAKAPDCDAAGLDLDSLVPYLQYQNSSLLEEVPALVRDADAELGWASRAFGAPPEAVNLWIGDERSVTSVHKDPYENLYAVVAGTKVFTLLPPSDVYRMALRRYPVAEYRPAGAAGGAAGSAAGVRGGGLVLEVPDPAQTVLWSSWRPEQVAAAAAAGEGGAGSGAGAGDAGLLSDPGLPRPLRVSVGPGEVLYLPAMWWHQVEQRPDGEGRAIAVNYWYDMAWDVKQAGLRMVERLAVEVGLNEAPPPPPLD